MAREYPGIYAEFDTKQTVPATPFVTPLYIWRPPLLPHAYGRVAGPDGLYQRDVGPRKAPMRATALPALMTGPGQRSYVGQSQSGNHTTQYIGLKAPHVPTTLQPRTVRQRS